MTKDERIADLEEKNKILTEMLRGLMVPPPRLTLSDKAIENLEDDMYGSGRPAI